MTPVTRSNFTLDDLTIELIDAMADVLRIKKSEIVRQGVGAYFLQMEKMLTFMADGTANERRVKGLIATVRKKKK
jgi:hypothetical protein